MGSCCYLCCYLCLRRAAVVGALIMSAVTPQRQHQAVKYLAAAAAGGAISAVINVRVQRGSHPEQQVVRIHRAAAVAAANTGHHQGVPWDHAA